MRLLLCLLSIACLVLSGCGSSSDDDITFGGEENAQATGSDSSDEASINTESLPEETEPQVTSEVYYFGQNGNLWKPSGDDHGGGAGNLVILLSSQFTEQFDNCEVRMGDGTVSQLICINDQPWTQIPYSCFSNGDRQTWRASFPCHEAAEVKAICRRPGQEAVFTVPEASRNQICSRHG